MRNLHALLGLDHDDDIHSSDDQLIAPVAIGVGALILIDCLCNTPQSSP
jgi:hypothetical protein